MLLSFCLDMLCINICVHVKNNFNCIEVNFDSILQLFRKDSVFLRKCSISMRLSLTEKWLHVHYIYTREIGPGGSFHRPHLVEIAPGGGFHGLPKMRNRPNLNYTNAIIQFSLFFRKPPKTYLTPFSYLSPQNKSLLVCKIKLEN